MVIFHSYVSHYQRVSPKTIPKEATTLDLLDPTATQISGVGGGHLTDQALPRILFLGLRPRTMAGCSKLFLGPSVLWSRKDPTVQSDGGNSCSIPYAPCTLYLSAFRLCKNVGKCSKHGAFENVLLKFCSDNKESNQQKMESNRSAIPAKWGYNP
jgi:hypothetical protein